MKRRRDVREEDERGRRRADLRGIQDSHVPALRADGRGLQSVRRSLLDRLAPKNWVPRVPRWRHFGLPVQTTPAAGEDQAGVRRFLGTF